MVIIGIKHMLEECGVPGGKSEKLAILLEQAMSHGINGTEFPPYTGFTSDDMCLGTQISKAISEKIAKRGKMKRESELRVGDIVERAGNTGGWGQMLIVKHDKSKRLLMFSRPYGSLSSVGTTCATMNVGIENFEAPYNEKVEWQTQFVVVCRDTVALMNDAFSNVRSIDRKRLNAYVNVLRKSLDMEQLEVNVIANKEWVHLQEEAMSLANGLIEKELDVPYPE